MDQPVVRYELWRDANEFSLFPVNNASARALLSPAAELLWSGSCSSWAEALAQKERVIGQHAAGSSDESA